MEVSPGEALGLEPGTVHVSDDHDYDPCADSLPNAGVLP